MDECKHDYVRYDKLPLGENPLLYYQCVGCGHVFMIKHNGFRINTNQLRPLLCYHDDCRERAIGRLRGRAGSRNYLRWVCKEHATEELV